MGSIFSCCKPDSAKILILGLDNSGKTTLLLRIVSIVSGKEFDPTVQIPHTIGQNLGNAHIFGMDCMLQDVGGQESLRERWLAYAHDAIIFVIDGADTSRFDEAKLHFHRVLQHACGPVILLVNKADLAECAFYENIVDYFQPEGAGSREVQILRASALTGDKVEAAFGYLIQSLRKTRLGSEEGQALQQL
eukprot:gnl/Dysnectes_brevis/5478_a7899_710.p1 GENE.gnl/Dysnectes_brevis/5478_a7899_710~~gnl/Dysnectes_brevis/5478_a7899_710.p1  ORF type:complete len:191 (-),score=21.32 gnl/Dysnectes_brevis/5478_a7899_710:120-692(-)